MPDARPIAIFTMNLPYARLILSLVLSLVLFALCAVTPAHEIRPAVVSVSIGPEHAVFEITVNAEAILAGIGPDHRDTDESPNAQSYNTLRALAPAELESAIRRDIGAYLRSLQVGLDQRPATLTLDRVSVRPEPDARLARITTLTVSAPVPQGTASFTFAYPAEYDACVLKVRRAGDAQFVSQWLTNGAAAKPFSLTGGEQRATRTETAARYIVLGFTHILPKGLDHILFVLGLFLLAARAKPLLIQVTAFTIAHSITLALAVYGVITLPPGIVEPLIALSIVYVAIENVVTPQLKPWRVFVVFGFGLLHGLGFAGVLTELGLPREEFVTALVGFNIGVEAGQLAVIALAYLVVGAWFRQRDWYRARVTIPASLAIAAVGLFWTVERMMG